MGLPESEVIPMPRLFADRVCRSLRDSTHNSFHANRACLKNVTNLILNNFNKLEPISIIFCA